MDFCRKRAGVWRRRESEVWLTFVACEMLEGFEVAQERARYFAAQAALFKDIYEKGRVYPSIFLRRVENPNHNPNPNPCSI